MSGRALEGELAWITTTYFQPVDLAQVRNGHCDPGGYECRRGGGCMGESALRLEFKAGRLKTNKQAMALVKSFGCALLNMRVQAARKAFDKIDRDPESILDKIAELSAETETLIEKKSGLKKGTRKYREICMKIGSLRAKIGALNSKLSDLDRMD